MSVAAASMGPWLRVLLGLDDSAPRCALEQYLSGIPRLGSLAQLPRGTRVLVRGDVDCKPGPRVGDGDVRLRSMRETLEYGRERGWVQVVFGHIGRKPEGTLRSVAARLGEILGTDVPLLDDWLDEGALRIRPTTVDWIRGAAPGSVLLLENTRRYEIERVLWKAKDGDVAKLAEPLTRLANAFGEQVAEVYVNEALSAGSLDASTTVVPLAMRSVALGAYVAREFDGPMRRCLASQMVVFSGLKTDKLDDLEAMIDRGTIRVVLSAGSLAMALKKAEARLAGRDFSLGLAENPANADKPYYIAPERIDQAQRMIERGRALGIRFVLPEDFVLADGRESPTLSAGDQQFDVGPRSRAVFARAVDEFIEQSRGRSAGSPPPAVFYNGVFGMFEDPRFEAGTREFIAQLKKMTDAGVEVYVGGGEGGTALEKYGQPDWVTHCFTAGGTVLNALGSQPVPYLQTLYEAASRARG